MAVWRQIGVGFCKLVCLTITGRRIQTAGAPVVSLGANFSAVKSMLCRDPFREKE
jgi:hypothetical protein